MPHASWGGPGLGRTVRVPVPGGGIQLNVHPEMETIFAELVRRLHDARTRARRPALMSSGGYVKRYISGTRTWSNHSWGLAADFNAGANPYSYVLRTDFPVEETRRIARELGFRWGHDYSGKKDPMHFEYAGSRDEAALLTRHLRGVAAPTPAPAPAPPQPAPVRPAPTPPEDEMRYPPTLKIGADGQAVRNLQGLLRAAGRTIEIDGSFGPGTDRVLREWQRAAGGEPDGSAGPWTWRTLLGV